MRSRFENSYISIANHMRTMSVEDTGDQIVLVPTQSTQNVNQKKLNTFEGVFIPVCLAMFSAILFLRLGKCSNYSTSICSQPDITFEYNSD